MENKTVKISEQQTKLYQAVKEVVIMVAKATNKRPCEIKGLVIKKININLSGK